MSHKDKILENRELDNVKLWPPEKEDEEVMAASSTSEMTEVGAEMGFLEDVDDGGDKGKDEEEISAATRINLMTEADMGSELVEDGDGGEEATKENEEEVSVEKEMGVEDVEDDESDNDVVEKVVKSNPKKRKYRQSKSPVNEDEFKKYKVADKYKINLENEFNKSSMRKKLFKIKCPLVRKKKDGSFTRPKTFHKKNLIHCNHWISWTCRMGTSEMPYNYRTTRPLELHVRTFLMNLGKKS